MPKETHMKKSLIIIVTTSFLLLTCKNSKVLELETFDNNRLGWNQEITDYHQSEISNGKFILHCKDTTNRQSTAGASYDDYLKNIPENYEISTDIEYLDGKKDKEFGLFLVSGSLEYTFSISKNGVIEIIENDLNTREPVSITSKDTVKKMIDFNKNKFNMKIQIQGWDYVFLVDGVEIYRDKLKTKTLMQIRLYAGATTKVAFDNFKITSLD
jgi:hypothetical protein